MPSDFTKRLLILSKVRGVGRTRLTKLAQDPIFYKVPLTELAGVYPELGAFQPSNEGYQRAIDAAAYDLEKCEACGDEIFSIVDSGYPTLLRSCEDAPVLLFVRGKGFEFSDKALAVIGTRHPTDGGRIVAERVTSYFASNQWVIVSGLANGIDTAAHKACLSAGGRTIAVLAHGLDHLAPKSNQVLADQIVENGGALVSEYGYKTPPFSSNFVERDRIQAGLAKGVLVIQTDVNGGSLHACRSSLRYGRLVVAPTPLKRDLMNGESKIQGILKLLHDTNKERIKLLNCAEDQLRRIVELHGREDYLSIENLLAQ